MKTWLIIALCAVAVLCGATVQAGIFDDVMKALGNGTKSSTGTGSALDTPTVVSGLKEALSIGTERAVKQVSKTDGYFGNQMIKILLPEKLQKVAEVMSYVGYQKEVDDFVLSMNRAAEKAAPKAASIFGDAVKKMSFEDARKILSGGNTAATDYFREKTRPRLYDEFKPVVVDNMGKVGVARSYKQMMGKYEALPFVEKESLDLDHYVTNKALDGLFLMVGEEEKKIRTDPVARTTELLRKVFSK